MKQKIFMAFALALLACQLFAGTAENCQAAGFHPLPDDHIIRGYGKDASIMANLMWYDSWSGTWGGGIAYFLTVSHVRNITNPGAWDVSQGELFITSMGNFTRNYTGDAGQSLEISLCDGQTAGFGDFNELPEAIYAKATYCENGKCMDAFNPPPPNTRPVIQNVSGPDNLLVGVDGSWQISAYDPDAEYLNYSVSWGDGSITPASASAGPFRHSYSSTGLYEQIFTVTDDQGAAAHFQAWVRAYELYEPSCPGFTRLGAGNSITDGKYSIELESIQVPNANSNQETVTFALKDGQAVIDTNNMGKGATFRTTMPNGDQITVDLCALKYDTIHANSWMSKAYMKLTVNGKPAIYGYQPSLEDNCANDQHFTKIRVGGLVQNSYLQVRLSDIGVATGASNTHPAILDILSASDNFSMQVMQATIEPYNYQPVILPWGKKIFISVCRTDPSFTLNSKGAEIKVQDESGAFMSLPNQPPVINSISGPTSLATNEGGTWGISASDPDGNRLSYIVEWGDGSGEAHADSDTAITFQRAYSSPGSHTITFIVTDSEGASAVSSLTVLVSGKPQDACNDTDGGKDFYKQGMVMQGRWEYLDTCVTKNRLFENYCNGTKQAVEAHICEYGCFNGACNTEPAPDPGNPPAPPDNISQLPRANATVGPTQPTPMPVQVAPAMPVAMEPAAPLPGQQTTLDGILALLEEIKQMLLQILNKI